MFVISSLTFLLLRTIPGGPFDEEKALPPDVKANIEAKYGLDKPLFIQYTSYLGGILKGDLGESYKYIGRPITEIIGSALPNSIQLGVYALLVAYLIGLPLGLIAAARHGTWIDHSSMMIAISGVSLPSFLVAPLFVILFSFTLGWFEPALWQGPTYYVLPMVVLGIRPAAVIARLTRASVLEVIRSDFIRTAKSKGLSERKILFKHVFRNSLIPVLSLTGPMVAGILTGSFVIELIFAIPGLAKHMVQSVTNRDYPLILGATLLFSFILVIANLITDLLMAMLDPRVKFS
jgi:oligopeptide transport system permease protein